jgi:hypothetical protein
MELGARETSGLNLVLEYRLDYLQQIKLNFINTVNHSAKLHLYAFSTVKKALH